RRRLAMHGATAGRVRLTASFSVSAFLIVLMTTARSSQPAFASATRHVSPTGIDAGDCTVNPCKTIAYAIGQSGPGHTVQVAAGTYPEHVVVDRSITLAGAGVSSTVIDGSGTGTVITIGASSASLTVSISRLTIQNGRGLIGGGITSVPGQ